MLALARNESGTVLLAYSIGIWSAAMTATMPTRNATNDDAVVVYGSGK